ncbi:molybdenum cofactor biosysynthesis protein [Devosia limi DSM 17137]|uniref:MOSC domain-containing protein YiiM n=1 Tax=Devosia limi DSM 17137 TaxID=1121477 RepID=A0A0F5LSF0_9HYPH|nr:MOSC domain-containing protein [Devosia limi]KKB85268.1 molybdenum cofactor biosysynthesis protein [Devosia limi DSM 17137]SHF87918.1 MOSC domain-containing protein YiiM [Devosia limi DSM 17137]
MARLESVNRGKAEPIPAKSALTGIYKRPVSGPVEIDRDGLVDDAIIDRRHHGGIDQAIYIYFADDYAWWSRELDAELAPGTFGENLTIDGITGSAVSVGDRFAIGPVLLEVTSHRTPCMVFAARMGDPGFVKRFHRAGRPGAYCRVITTGAIEAGMPVGYQNFAGAPVTVSELMALDGIRDIPAATLERALAAPVHYKLRHDYEQRLARLF